MIDEEDDTNVIVGSGTDIRSSTVRIKGVDETELVGASNVPGVVLLSRGAAGVCRGGGSMIGVLSGGGSQMGTVCSVDSVVLLSRGAAGVCRGGGSMIGVIFGTGGVVDSVPLED